MQDLILKINQPSEAEVSALTARPGKALVSLLAPRQNEALLLRLAKGRVAALALDAVPRMLSRAQVFVMLASFLVAFHPLTSLFTSGGSRSARKQSPF